jgi:hypothetical protein
VVGAFDPRDVFFVPEPDRGAGRIAGGLPATEAEGLAVMLEVSFPICDCFVAVSPFAWVESVFAAGEVFDSAEGDAAGASVIFPVADSATGGF